MAESKTKFKALLLERALQNCIKFSAVTLEITFDSTTATPLKVTFRWLIYMEIFTVNISFGKFTN